MTGASSLKANSFPAAIRRLHHVAELDRDAEDALRASFLRSTCFGRHAEVLREGQAISGALLVLDGWTARIRQLPDGRRQLVSFGLPGEVLGYAELAGVSVSTTVVALNPVTVCPLPDPARSPSLSRAFAVSRALDEAYLMAQITRLGRMNAHERVMDLLLELHGRLMISGLARNGRFRVPLTQEAMADALGLTPVHLNRTVQQIRRNGDLAWVGREVTLGNERDAAASIAHRAPHLLTPTA